MAASANNEKTIRTIVEIRTRCQIRLIAALFQAMNQNKNAAPKIASTIQAKGGQAMTIIASAIQVMTFRNRTCQLRVNHAEIATITSISPAPQ